jgi:hypothetical protein
LAPLGRTRAVSACTTRATRLARTRSVPCPSPHISASSAAPPAIEAGRDASSGRGGAMRCRRAGASPHAVALRQRRARAAQAAHVTGAAPPPMAQRHEPAGAVVRPARRSTVRGACVPLERGRCVARGRSDGTRAPKAGAAAREGVLLVCSRGGITPENVDSSPPRPRPGDDAEHAPQGSARRPNPVHQTPPAHASSRGVSRCWLDTTPHEGPTGTTHD